MRRSLSRSQRAVAQFGLELNCAQAVLGEFVDDLGTDYGLALRMSCGFGLGMGCSGCACGAVTGGIMAIGLKAGVLDPRKPDVKARVYDLVRDFVSGFERRNGSVLCAELLGCDISTTEGFREAERAGLFSTRCAEYVADAVQSLEKIFKELDSQALPK